MSEIVEEYAKRKAVSLAVELFAEASLDKETVINKVCSKHGVSEGVVGILYDCYAPQYLK